MTVTETSQGEKRSRDANRILKYLNVKVAEMPLLLSFLLFLPISVENQG